MLLTNKRKAKLFKALKQIRLPYLPFSLGIETGNICNLKCPLCPTGSGQDGMRKGFLTFSVFRTVFDQLKKSLKSINLYSWGEPLLNKDLIPIIRYIKKQNPSIRVTTSTNLNINDKNLLTELVESGIDEIIVSCDGASQQSYSKYRVGGDFSLVIQNLKFLVQKKHGLKLTTAIIWNFLVFKHNEHEVEIAREMTKAIGADFRVGLMRTSMKDEILQDHNKAIEKDLDYIPDNPEYSAYDKQKMTTKKMLTSCRKPWQEISVNWDGKVFPCCAIYGDKYNFGSTFESSINEIWNNTIYQKARSEILRLAKSAETICGICKKHGFTHM